MSKYPASPHRGEQRQSARMLAYEYLSNGILSGDLPEGTYLDETSVAHALGISRTPVREALRQLSGEKYVSLVPRRGAQVRYISIQEMQEIYEARFLIESAAIDRICVQKLDIPQNSAVLIGRMDALAEQQDWLAFAQTDHLFHSQIVHMYDNTVLGELYDFLSPRHIRLAVRALERSPDRVPHLHDEHEAILQAIVERDAPRAQRLLAEHLRFNPSVASSAS